MTTGSFQSVCKTVGVVTVEHYAFKMTRTFFFAWISSGCNFTATEIFSASLPFKSMQVSTHQHDPYITAANSDVMQKRKTPQRTNNNKTDENTKLIAAGCIM